MAMMSLTLIWPGPLRWPTCITGSTRGFAIACIYTKDTIMEYSHPLVAVTRATVAKYASISSEITVRRDSCGVVRLYQHIHMELIPHHVRAMYLSIYHYRSYSHRHQSHLDLQSYLYLIRCSSSHYRTYSQRELSLMCVLMCRELLLLWFLPFCT